MDEEEGRNLLVPVDDAEVEGLDSVERWIMITE